MLRVTTPPDPVVSPDDLGLADDDATSAAIGAAIQFLDGPLGYLGASLGPQALELTLPNWDCLYGAILPCGPVIAITSIKYLDANGVEQTVASNQYRVIRGSLGDTVYFVPDFSAPGYYCAPDAIRVAYTAGYDDSVNPKLPETIKRALGLLASQTLSTGKMAAGTGVKSIEIPGVAIKTYDTSGAASAGQQGVVSSAITNLLTGYIRRSMI